MLCPFLQVAYYECDFKSASWSISDVEVPDLKLSRTWSGITKATVDLSDDRAQTQSVSIISCSFRVDSTFPNETYSPIFIKKGFIVTIA